MSTVTTFNFHLLPLANQPHKAKRTIMNPGVRHQPRKIAKKGTGKRSALETSESAEA
jgi:hypothetical protein